MPRALLDTNVLIHAVYRASPLHAPAATLVNEGLHKSGQYCIAPQNLIEFSANVTRSRAIDPPIGAIEASRITSLLYRSRRLTKIYPGRGTVMRAVAEGAALNITGTVWYDLFLAMTMRDAGVSVIVTEDVSDFGKFPFITARTIREMV